MPTYQYRCKECSDEFDIVQSFSDDPLTECAKCDGALKKVYGNVGISFKGSGFYKNDARGKTSSTSVAPASSDSSTSSTSSSASESSSTSSTTTKSAEKKTETKTAAKKD